MSGNAAINSTGTINAVAAGIDAQTTTGNLTINAANVTSTASYGIGTRSINGTTTVTDTGTVTAGGDGILLSKQAIGDRSSIARGVIFFVGLLLFCFLTQFLCFC